MNCSSGGAIGEQMGANGINDEPILGRNEDPPTTSGKCDSVGGKRMRTGHSYCNSVVAAVDGDNDDPNGLSPASPPKRKRTRHRGKPSSSSSPLHLFTEEVELANSLIMLSSSRIKPIPLIADVEGPSTSATKKDDNLSHLPAHLNPLILNQKPPIRPNMFECKDCKKVFPSHQALGGHRASHKKVNGCYAARLKIESLDTENILDEEKYKKIGSSLENKPLSIIPLAENSPPPLLKNNSQFHECSVCRRQFPTGQALGGHMRCHWNKKKTDESAAVAVEQMTVASAPHTQTLQQLFTRSDYSLDLNKPVPMDDLAGIPPLLDVPATIYVQPGWNIENKTKEFEKVANENFEDEAESKLCEFAQLSHLKDLNDGVESSTSTWLQIGFGSSDDRPIRPNL